MKKIFKKKNSSSIAKGSRIVPFVKASQKYLTSKTPALTLHLTKTFFSFVNQDGLSPFRSPLLRGSQLFSFPLPTEML